MKREELKEKIKDYFIDFYDELATDHVTKEFMGWIDEYVKPKGKSLEERLEKFLTDVCLASNKYGAQMTKDFYEYWTEHNEGGKKMRFEMSKNQPFNIKRRLVTWAKRSKNYNNGRPTSKSKAELANEWLDSFDN